MEFRQEYPRQVAAPAAEDRRYDRGGRTRSELALLDEKTNKERKMNMMITELSQEAHVIITNARQALDSREITLKQYDELIRNLLLDLGYLSKVLQP